MDELTKAGLGQSTVVGIGGDPVIGQTFSDVLRRFEEDGQTKAVVLIGEVGGALEEEGARSTDLPLRRILPEYRPHPKRGWGMPDYHRRGEGDARSRLSGSGRWKSLSQAGP